MLTDNSLLLAGSISGVDNSLTAQAMTSASTSVLSVNAIDTYNMTPNAQVRDLAEGEPLTMHVTCIAANSGGTSMEFQLIASDAADGTGNVTVIASTGPIPVAQLVAGAKFAAGVNPKLAKLGQRYLTARAVSVGTTSGTTNFIWLGTTVADGMKFYPAGSAIL